MPLHPLVKQATQALNSKQKVFSNLFVASNDIPAGNYEFAIYQWRFHGIKEDLVLKPIAFDGDVTRLLGKLLENAMDCPNDVSGELGSSIWDDLDAQHYSLWSDARKIHRNKTQELAEYRRESLSTSHRARIAFLEEQLRLATNEKIQQMRGSQISIA